ncbi:MAG: TetR/AcrR family transcriptional regulator [Phenylobacterium sp.]|nr:MAG: TetR/AcrR family transcriptional regulator [Phenylobacterium sp.]
MLSKARLDRDARRDAILDVAQDVFLEEGFAAASMSSIAARLGGSKGTLYNYFKSKDELFEAYVLRRCVLNLDDIYVVRAEGEGPREVLTRLGRAYVGRVLSDENLRHFRLIIAEAERSPEIGRAFYEAGPLKGAGRLARHISEWAAAGKLQVDDPMRAAHQFLALCQNRYFKERLTNYAPELTPEQIETEVTGAVETFLRAFGPRGG